MAKLRSHLLGAGLLAIAIGCSAGPRLSAQTPLPVEPVTWSQSGWVEYQPGNAPLLLTAPHGGYLRPPEVSDRKYGTLVQDGHTQELARELRRAFERRTGFRPHLILSHLHRRKLDPNRELDEAAQGNPTAVQAWQDFHAFIETAKERIEDRWQYGLLIDLHGHAHPRDWIELGYGLNSKTLALPEPELETDRIRSAHTLRALLERRSLELGDLLRGVSSMGAMLERRGFESVPGPSIPHPDGAPYFNGGYIVRRHGSRTKGSIDAIQFELPGSLRKRPRARQAFVEALADSAREFLERHYALEFDDRLQVRLLPPTERILESDSSARLEFERGGALETALDLSLAWNPAVRADFRALPSRLRFPAGASRATLDLRPKNDSRREGLEWVDFSANRTGVGHEPLRWTIPLFDDDTPADSGIDLLVSTASKVRGKPSGLAFDGRGTRAVVVAPLDQVGEFTLHLRFRIGSSSNSGWRYLLAHRSAGSPNSLNLYYSKRDGLLRTNLARSLDLSSPSVLDSAFEAEVDRSYDYVLTVDADGRSRVYLDGVLRAEAFHGRDVSSFGSDWKLGGPESNEASRCFQGRLERARLYDFAIPHAAIGVLDYLGD